RLFALHARPQGGAADRHALLIDAVMVTPYAARLTAEHGQGLSDLWQLQVLRPHLFAGSESPAGRASQPLSFAQRPTAVVPEQYPAIHRGLAEGHHHVTCHCRSLLLLASEERGRLTRNGGGGNDGHSTARSIGPQAEKHSNPFLLKCERRRL